MRIGREASVADLTNWTTKMKTAATLALVLSTCLLSALAAVPKAKPPTRPKANLLKGSLTEAQLKKLVEQHAAKITPTPRHDDPVVNTTGLITLIL